MECFPHSVPVAPSWHPGVGGVPEVSMYFEERKVIFLSASPSACLSVMSDSPRGDFLQEETVFAFVETLTGAVCLGSSVQGRLQVLSLMLCPLGLGVSHPFWKFPMDSEPGPGSMKWAGAGSAQMPPLPPSLLPG